MAPGRRRRRGPRRSASGRCGSTRPGSTTSSCCSPPTSAPSPRPLGQGRLRRRAVPGDARPRGRAGRHQPGARRSCSTRSTPGSAARRRSRWAAGSALLARHAQVLVVTHLPQVAAFADRHVVVAKADDGTRHHLGADRPRRRGPGPRAVPDARRAGGLRHRARPRRGAARRPHAPPLTLTAPTPGAASLDRARPRVTMAGP